MLFILFPINVIYHFFKDPGVTVKIFLRHQVLKLFIFSLRVPVSYRLSFVLLTSETLPTERLETPNGFIEGYASSVFSFAARFLYRRNVSVITAEAGHKANRN